MKKSMVVHPPLGIAIAGLAAWQQPALFALRRTGGRTVIPAGSAPIAGAQAPRFRRA
jgi:hypothetical protein